MASSRNNVISTNPSGGNRGSDHNPRHPPVRQKSEDSQIIPITDAEYKDIRDKYSSKTNRRKKDVRDSAFLNRVIKHLGEHKAGLECDADAVEKRVKELVEEILDEVSHFKGELIPCGSYYEGVKVREPNEFDYIYELQQIDMTEFEIKHVDPQTFKPRKKDDIRARSYYKLNSKAGEVSARELQANFKAEVEKVLKDNFGEEETAVTCNGPAVTLYLRLETEIVEQYLNPLGKKHLRKMGKEYGGFVIKVDISLALPVKAKPGQRWPLEGYSDAELNFDMLASDTIIQKCHLVPSGDFWRVSFSRYETELMSEHSKNVEKKRIFQALKYLRDELSLTDTFEAELLSTYPLKVTFMKEAQEHNLPADWEFWNLSERAIDILKKVEQEGTEGTLSSYFLKNDSILLESDRSYLECRRLRQYLVGCETKYHIHGLFHTISTSIIAVCMLAIMVSSAVYTSQFLEYDIPDDSPDLCLPVKKHEPEILGTFLFVVFPTVFVALLSSFLGIMWVVVPKYLLPTNSVLHFMFGGVLVVHIILCVVSTVLMVCSICLAVGYSNMFGCFEGHSTVRNITYFMIFLSALCLLGLLVHVVIVMVLIQGRVRRYMWEWVFFDELYKDKIFSKLGYCKKNASGQKYGTGSDAPLPNANQNGADDTVENPIYGCTSFNQARSDVELHV